MNCSIAAVDVLEPSVCGLTTSLTTKYPVHDTEDELLVVPAFIANRFIAVIVNIVVANCVEFIDSPETIVDALEAVIHTA